MSDEMQPPIETTKAKRKNTATERQALTVFVLLLFGGFCSVFFVYRPPIDVLLFPPYNTAGFYLIVLLTLLWLPLFIRWHGQLRGSRLYRLLWGGALLVFCGTLLLLANYEYVFRYGIRCTYEGASNGLQTYSCRVIVGLGSQQNTTRWYYQQVNPLMLQLVEGE
jgi:hypothetical protein